jgi:hypothetical protein
VADFDDTKVSAAIREFIERAGELEQMEASAALRRYASRNAEQEPPTQKPTPDNLPSLPVSIIPCSSSFNLESANQFIKPELLQWGHAPKEFIKWLSSELEQQSLSSQEIYFKLRDSIDHTTIPFINHPHLINTLKDLASCGLLHTKVQSDRTEQFRYPVEKYVFNPDREAQLFLKGILDEANLDSSDIQIDQDALYDLKRILSRTDQFNSSAGLINFIQQFDVAPNATIGSGAILNLLGDFTHSTRQLVEHALSCAAQANIITGDQRELFRITPAGKGFLTQLLQEQAA